MLTDIPSGACRVVRPAFEDRLAHLCVLSHPDWFIDGEDDLIETLEPEEEEPEAEHDERLDRILYLSAVDRAALELRVIHRMTFQEIGDIVGISRQAAHKAYLRALSRVRG